MLTFWSLWRVDFGESEKGQRQREGVKKGKEEGVGESIRLVGVEEVVCCWSLGRSRDSGLQPRIATPALAPILPYIFTALPLGLFIDARSSAPTACSLCSHCSLCSDCTIAFDATSHMYPEYTKIDQSASLRRSLKTRCTLTLPKSPNRLPLYIHVY